MKRTAQKRKSKVPPEQNRINSPALVHMRDVAFGQKTSTELWKANDRSERMRNDQALLDAAEAKRQRKADRNRGQA